MTVDAGGFQWDFFVSYTQADRGWAEWIAWELEEGGHRVLIQAWDIVPGSNWVHEMHVGMSGAARTIAVLSADYLKSVYGSAEWQAAWAADAAGKSRKLLPIRVADCDRPGLLGQVVSVDVFGRPEVEARRVLREAVLGAVTGRLKPVAAPGFPGAGRVMMSQPRFPGGLPPVWNVPARGPNFVGRAEELAELDADLRSGGFVAVSALRGMGGVGKTRLALEYAYRHAHEFDVVWWVQAEQAAAIAGQLAALGVLLGVPVDTDVTASATATLAVLQRTPRWLLVFDNAEDPQEIRPWLPIGAGRVLVTTRRAGFRALGRVLDVDLLPREEAIGLLRGRMPDLTAADAGRVAELLGDLPLALEQAAAYMEKTDMRGGDYVSLLETRLGEMLDKGRVIGQEQRVATLWDLSYQRLATEDPTAVVLLRMLAYLAPDAIPLDLLPEGGLPEPLAALRDRGRWLEAIGALADYSLVRRDGSMVSLHRLVRATVQQQAAAMPDWDEAAWLDALAAMLLQARPTDHDARHPQTWNRWALLRPHITAVLSAIDTTTTTTTTAHLATPLADYLHARGELPAARDLQERSQEVLRRVLGAEHPDTLTTMHQLAWVMWDMGERAAARDLFEQVLDVQRRVLGAEHPDTLMTMQSMAVVMSSMGERAAARDLYEQVLDVRRRVLGAEHPDTLTTMQSLAGVMSNMGERAAARELHERSLDVRRRVLGPEHPHTLTTMHDLAAVMSNMGERAAARDLYEQVLEVQRRVLGPEHPHTLTTMHDLAGVMSNMGERAAARDLYEQVLDVERRVLGAEHPDTLATMHGLAGVMSNMGERAAARDLYEQVLEVQRRVLGPEHPHTLTTMHDLAAVMSHIGERAAARDLYEQVLDVERRVLGAEHPDTLITMHSLAAVMSHIGERAAARDLLEQVLDMRRRVLGAEHPHTLTTMHDLGWAMLATGKRAAGRRLLDQAKAAKRPRP
ncbi:FxSxx-COOH system tetratricopeptide repeat protein [Catellatospora tritici]|uniref:FxSxx-COOH system tetratricopeptide repeat protein n=1 Tax=Catellatospora tritici TaxID=2851566 RepID=UPI001C2D69AE|nr:FxSxx-COOH system tetratricopeptide repeat protein [Catellatospora tritici]MBV1854614.1 tetratricopeptide repeat protein [Catellatospora tritici]